MYSTDDGIAIYVNDVQFLKALTPIDITEFGMVIFVNEEHSLNDFNLISVIGEKDQLFSMTSIH